MLNKGDKSPLCILHKETAFPCGKAAENLRMAAECYSAVFSSVSSTVFSFGANLERSAMTAQMPMTEMMVSGIIYVAL